MSDPGDRTVVIRCRDNGPLVIDGPAQLRDGEGRPLTPPANAKGNIALCRCGLSTTKPFCDGSHRGQAFRSIIRADAKPSDPADGGAESD